MMKHSFPTLQARFLDIVQKFPTRPALEIGDDAYNYQELCGIALQITQAIAEMRSTTLVVSIIADKNLTSYTGILGTLLTGKAYCPILANTPVQRTLEIIIQAESDIIIIDEKDSEALEGLLEIAEKRFTIISLAEIADNIKQKFSNHHYINAAEYPVLEKFSAIGIAADYAYLIFTSGSTGKPKGVPIRQHNIMHYVAKITELFEITENDRMSQVAVLSFDLSIQDLFGCWLNGACLCPVPDSAMFAPVKFIKQKQITFFCSVPSQISMMKKLKLLQKNIFPNLRLSFFAGEAFNVELAEAWEVAAPNTKLYNGYGPTEATVLVSFYEWKNGVGAEQNKVFNGSLSIGMPSQDSAEFILVDGNAKTEETQSKTSGKTEGELLIAGPQLTEGYWKNAEQTREKFVKIQGMPQLWYRTGDWLTQDEDGFLYFMSRTDHQVKLRGHRIELEEISATIRKITGEDTACALVNDKEQIIVFVQSDKEFENSSIKQQAKEFLPHYMIPDKIIMLEILPLNINGKIDRAELKKLS